MKQTLTLLTAACLALSLAGCAHVNSTVLEAGLSPVPVGQVQVYLTGEDIPSHKKVGILYAEGSANSRQALFEKLREAAAEMGANGIILSPMRESKKRIISRAKVRTEAVAIHVETAAE